MPRLVRSFLRRAVARPAALAVALILAAVGLQAGAAAGPGTPGPPGPVRIVVDGISSAVAAPTGTPGGAVPYVLVEAGQEFFVDVSFYDATGALASFNQDTTLSIETNTGRANAPMPATGTAPRGATSVRLTTSLPLPANQVQVTVDAPGAKGPNDVAAGVSTKDQLFDVLTDLQFHDTAPGAPFSAGIGGDMGCTQATKDDPVCGVLLLPQGAESPQVLLSLGLCDASYGGCGSARGSVVQALGDLGVLYTKTAPATLLVKCDKTLCGKGALQATTLSYSLLGNAALEVAPACPGKGTIGTDQEVCVDYVSSNRDNSGDSWLHLLLTHDARVSVR
jgi:hypothetical protein